MIGFQNLRQIIVAGQPQHIAVLDFKAHQVFAVRRAVAFTGARVRSERVDKAFIVTRQSLQVAETAFETGNHACIQCLVFYKPAGFINADDTECMVGFVFRDQQLTVRKLLYGRRLKYAVKHIDTQRTQLCRVVGRRHQQ